MKFARYLQEAQTQEWKKEYIDYGGLKKRIAAIRIAQQQHQQEIIDSADQGPEGIRSRSVSPPPKLGLDEHESIPLPPLKAKRLSVKSDSAVVSERNRRKSHNRLSLRGMIPGLHAAPHHLTKTSSTIGSRPAQRAELLGTLPLHELLTLLTPLEAAFFTMLDGQLEKVESFYLGREKEMISRGRILQMQLKELNEHRDVVLKAHSTLPWAASITSAIKLNGVVRRTKASDSAFSLPIEIPNSPVLSNEQRSSNLISHVRFDQQTPTSLSSTTSVHGIHQDGKPCDRSNSLKKGNKLKRKTLNGPGLLDADPDGYFYAKRKLKKAVLEHYRGLELLHNYRVVNITGFRKAVKKFEKVTKIPVQNQYMAEKVESAAFASSMAVKEMMTQMEDMYALAFLSGDRKTAARRLRIGVDQSQTQYSSILRLGLYLGLSIPALVIGLVEAFKNSKRNANSAWSALLFVYGVFFVPVIFSLLVGLNIVAWSSTRINYVFIFELPVSSHLNYRKYFEIPAILLLTLIYAFFLSFSEIEIFDSYILNPELWPLVWLAFAGLVLMNPFPIMHRCSRYWFLRSVGKQFLSGLRPVDYTDFWLADQLCSMTFTLSNLSTVVCVYVHWFRQSSFPVQITDTCGNNTNLWPVAFSISCLPFVMRLLQSLKRHFDSGKNIHLVNVVKYASGILADFFSFYSRHRNDRRELFVVWCIWSVFSSVYGCAWDLMMDWSILSLHNAKNPLLRPNLLYSNHVYVYYFAMVSNILLRFGWVFYIPRKGPDMMVRSFVLGMLEMLRRWQWNFFRLENEHLGNMDQYRVTREVPLPYAFDRDEDEVEEEKHLTAQIRNQRTG